MAKYSSEKKSLLDKINSPSDLKKIAKDKKNLSIIAGEIRQEIIDKISITGGHLGAGLGVIELTTAIHYVFNTPKDRLIFDVGHQSYPHKILTGRKNKMHTIRQGGGISGFTKRNESEYDAFGAGHSSTSISAGLGMAVARDLSGRDNNVICVIGDGAMSAGMAYEAMNNAGNLKNRLIVILNDNDMSIAPPVGAMSAYLSRIISGKTYVGMRELGKKVAGKLPTPLQKAAQRAEAYARGFWTGGTLFEEMGFYYIGPIDGHNFDHLLPILENLRDSKRDGPILLHVVTKKGKGYEPAENATDKMHGVSKFNIVTGKQNKAKSINPSCTKVFSESLLKAAEKDNKIVAITAAMPSGTGLDSFQKKFPERFFDVGIAEQHAVTFAAGLACEGYKPFCAIYSSFLQRAYDQIMHDVALQKLPVKFAVDRAGLVGADGATHAGSFDTTILGCLPNMVLMAPADKNSLQNMTATMAAYNEGPIAMRYPRGESFDLKNDNIEEILEIGKGRIISEGSKIALLSYGTRLEECLKAASKLNALGLSTTVADARFAKPLDEELIKNLTNNHEVLITIEDGSRGGFGSYVLQSLAKASLLDGRCKIYNMNLPDIFIGQDTQINQYDIAELNSKHIIDRVLKILAIDETKTIQELNLFSI